MSSDSNYTFYNINRVEDDKTTQTQKEMQNDRFSSYFVRPVIHHRRHGAEPAGRPP